MILAIAELLSAADLEADRRPARGSELPRGQGDGGMVGAAGEE